MSSIFARLTRPFSASTMRVAPEGGGAGTNNPPTPVPEGMQKATIAAGCFWGPEHMYRHHFPKDAFVDTRVGYIGGDTENPSYRAVCSGRTGREFPSSSSFLPFIKSFFFRHPTSTVTRCDSFSRFVEIKADM